MVKKQKDPNTKHYFNPVPESEIASHLDKLKASGNLIQIWPEGESEKNIEEYQYVELDSHQLFIKPNGLLKKLKKSSLINNKIFLKYTDETTQYFAHTTLYYDSERRQYWLDTKKLNLYHTIQRKDYRLSAGPHTRIRLQLSENFIIDCNDVSAGGASFMVKKDELENYPLDKEFTNCPLRINTEIFELPKVKVLKHIKLKNNTKIKVGLAFPDKDDVLDVKLCKAINIEAKAVEIRKFLIKKK